MLAKKSFYLVGKIAKRIVFKIVSKSRAKHKAAETENSKIFYNTRLKPKFY